MIYLPRTFRFWAGMCFSLVLSTFTAAVSATVVGPLSDVKCLGQDAACTLDARSQLQWLDLSFTFGKSIAQTEDLEFFKSGGFQWATEHQIVSLFNSVFPSLPLGGLSFQADGLVTATQFQSFVGFATNQVTGARSSRAISALAPSPSDGSLFLLSNISRNFSTTGQVTESASAPGKDGSWSRTQSSGGGGAWLVRLALPTGLPAPSGVPEPSSLALLALGLAGIGFSRRKTA